MYDFFKRLKMDAEVRQSIRRATYREFAALLEKVKETFEKTDFNNPLHVVELTDLFNACRKSAHSYRAKVREVPFSDIFLVSGTYMVEQHRVNAGMDDLCRMLEIAVNKIP
jgi:hypothetical protein